MSKLTIYGVKQSRTLRTLWMAAELGLEYEHVEVSFRSDDLRAPEFLALNRAGRIPAIRDGELTMGESCAINIYLAKKHGKLMPAGGLEDEARVLEWCFWAMTTVEKPILNYLFHTTLMPDDQKDAAVAEEAKAELQWPMQVIDGFLAEHEWLVGDAFSVADLNVAAIFLWGRMSKLDITAFPNLKEWLGRCLSRPALPGR